MQKLLRIIFLSWIFFCNSCQEPTRKNVPAEKLPEDSVSFFPVTEFIKGQIKEIEYLPVTPLKIDIDGARHDSSWIDKKDIKKYAEPFLHPEIDSLSLANLFIGKSFLDQTIDAFTFSYDAKAKLPDSIKLTHWDVYIDPHKNKVQRIYMIKSDAINSRSVTTQLTWMAGKWFSIRNIIQLPGGEPEIKEQIFKWDFDE
ncbi:MAG: hypothetical protein ABI594_06175 [Ginsengibacter sp.]